MKVKITPFSRSKADIRKRVEVILSKKTVTRLDGARARVRLNAARAKARLAVPEIEEAYDEPVIEPVIEAWEDAQPITEIQIENQIKFEPDPFVPVFSTDAPDEPAEVSAEDEKTRQDSLVDALFSQIDDMAGEYPTDEDEPDEEEPAGEEPEEEPEEEPAGEQSEEEPAGEQPEEEPAGGEPEEEPEEEPEDNVINPDAPTGEDDLGGVLLESEILTNVEAIKESYGSHRTRFVSRDENGHLVEADAGKAQGREVVCFDGVSGKPSRVCGLIRREALGVRG